MPLVAGSVGGAIAASLCANGWVIEASLAGGGAADTPCGEGAAVTIVVTRLSCGLARSWSLRHLRPSMLELEGIDHVALAVRDVQRSARWYIDVLGFERRHEDMWDGVPVFVGKGTTALALFATHEPNPTARPRDSITMLHLAFRTSRDGFAAAKRDLNTRGIAFHFQDHEISHSIYFHDPDGHELEITTYEV